jgi:hypothetical protein
VAIETDAERAIFLNTDEFAVIATYTPDGGSAVSINGIFDNAYDEIEGPHAGLETSNPAFTCLSSDVSSAAHGDTLLVNSLTYTVAGVKPDGTGMTTLELEAP